MRALLTFLVFKSISRHSAKKLKLSEINSPVLLNIVEESLLVLTNPMQDLPGLRFLSLKRTLLKLFVLIFQNVGNSLIEKIFGKLPIFLSTNSCQKKITGPWRDENGILKNCSIKNYLYL